MARAVHCRRLFRRMCASGQMWAASWGRRGARSWCRCGPVGRCDPKCDEQVRDGAVADEGGFPRERDVPRQAVRAVRQRRAVLRVPTRMPLPRSPASECHWAERSLRGCRCRAGMRPSWSSPWRSSSAPSQAPRRPRTAAHRAGRSAHGRAATRPTPRRRPGRSSPKATPTTATRRPGRSLRTATTMQPSSEGRVGAPVTLAVAVAQLRITAVGLLSELPCSQWKVFALAREPGPYLASGMIRRVRRTVACRLGSALADVPLAGTRRLAVHNNPSRWGARSPRPPHRREGRASTGAFAAGNSARDCRGLAPGHRPEAQAVRKPSWQGHKALSAPATPSPRSCHAAAGKGLFVPLRILISVGAAE